MKQSNFTEVQIVKILSEQNQGKTVNEICREHGINQPTFYKWKSKYGGMEAHQLAQLKELEKQLSQYKKIVAELTLENVVLKDVIEKKL
ncbi:transposase [Empedobacter stercoris]|uniref:transposase n=1 Tax=Empedobacter stercoris TaxID=1628248 RepID=UPI0039EB1866